MGAGPGQVGQTQEEETGGAGPEFPTAQKEAENEQQLILFSLFLQIQQIKVLLNSCFPCLVFKN